MKVGNVILSGIPTKFGVRLQGKQSFNVNLKTDLGNIPLTLTGLIQKATLFGGLDMLVSIEVEECDLKKYLQFTEQAMEFNVELLNGARLTAVCSAVNQNMDFDVAANNCRMFKLLEAGSFPLNMQTKINSAIIPMIPYQGFASMDLSNSIGEISKTDICHGLVNVSLRTEISSFIKKTYVSNADVDFYLCTISDDAILKKDLLQSSNAMCFDASIGAMICCMFGELNDWDNSMFISIDSKSLMDLDYITQ